MIPRLLQIAKEANERIDDLEIWEAIVDALIGLKREIEAVSTKIDKHVGELTQSIDDANTYTEKVEERVTETSEHVEDVDERLQEIEAIEVRDGKDGEKGDKGEKGERGEQGVQGEKGEKGEKGDKGDKGEQGERGLRGYKGQRGLRGFKGDNGSPDEPEDIVEKLQDYTKDTPAWLEARAIKNLPYFISKRGGGGSGGDTIVTNEGRYIKHYIASSETVELVDYEQYNIYRELVVDGEIQLGSGSQVNIIAD